MPPQTKHNDKLIAECTYSFQLMPENFSKTLSGKGIITSWPDLHTYLFRASRSINDRRIHFFIFIYDAKIFEQYISGIISLDASCRTLPSTFLIDCRFWERFAQPDHPVLTRVGQFSWHSTNRRPGSLQRISPNSTKAREVFSAGYARFAVVKNNQAFSAIANAALAIWGVICSINKAERTPHTKYFDSSSTLIPERKLSFFCINSPPCFTRHLHIYFVPR